MNIKTVLGLPLAALLATAAIAPVSAATLTRPDGIYVRCDQCGVVQSIEHNVVAGREHGTAGAVIGAIAGGVLGNQVGKGKGRTLATVGGAVGGGFAGNAIGARIHVGRPETVVTACVIGALTSTLVATVAQVLQPGWRMRSGRVLRHASVAVAEPGSPAAQEQPATE